MSETRSEFEPAVSTSGRHIAFVQNRGNLSLALVIEDLSKTLVGEVPPGGGFSGMHSPAFTSNRDGNYEIYVKKLDGSGLLRLTNNAEQDDFPVWDPEGNSLIVVGERDGQSDLYRIPASTF